MYRWVYFRASIWYVSQAVIACQTLVCSTTLAASAAATAAAVPVRFGLVVTFTCSVAFTCLWSFCFTLEMTFSFFFVSPHPCIYDCVCVCVWFLSLDVISLNVLLECFLSSNALFHRLWWRAKLWLDCRCVWRVWRRRERLHWYVLQAISSVEPPNFVS